MSVTPIFQYNKNDNCNIINNTNIPKYVVRVLCISVRRRRMRGRREKDPLHLKWRISG
jgi:hypothetical protein